MGVPMATATINAADVFTPARKFPGPFLVRIKSSPGTNVVRVQCCDTENGTFQNATDSTGVEYELSEAGTYPFANPSGSLYWRVGCPAGDYATGSFAVEVSGA